MFFAPGDSVKGFGWAHPWGLDSCKHDDAEANLHVCAGTHHLDISFRFKLNLQSFQIIEIGLR